ncbi:MAG: LysR substrate-binding domain-containing protein [Polyangiales bacterium]
MNPPNLLALIALEAVARLGSVTRAASALHLTQSAVSHRLHSLQRELGVTLVERSGRGVRLTPQGHELARAAQLALSQLEQAIERLGPAASERVLSISCSPSFAIRFLVPRMAAFRSAHPTYDLRIASADVPVDPGHGADAAIHLSAGPTPRLHCEKLVDEIAFPVVSPHLLERGAPLRTPSDLAHYPLLHDDAFAHDPARVDWPVWFERTGAARELRARMQRGVRFSHAYLALEAALAGDGVALARRSLVADDLVRGRLVAPLPQGVPSGLTYWFVSAASPEERPAIGLLRDYLAQQLQAAQQVADRARTQRRRKAR